MSSSKKDATDDVLIAPITKQIVQIQRGWVPLADRMHSVGAPFLEVGEQFVVETFSVHELLKAWCLLKLLHLFRFPATEQVKLFLFSNDVSLGLDDTAV